MRISVYAYAYTCIKLTRITCIFWFGYIWAALYLPIIIFWPLSLKKMAPKTSFQGPLWPPSKIFWLKHWYIMKSEYRTLYHGLFLFRNKKSLWQTFSIELNFESTWIFNICCVEIFCITKMKGGNWNWIKSQGVWIITILLVSLFLSDLFM